MMASTIIGKALIDVYKYIVEECTAVKIRIAIFIKEFDILTMQEFMNFVMLHTALLKLQNTTCCCA